MPPSKKSSAPVKLPASPRKSPASSSSALTSSSTSVPDSTLPLYDWLKERGAGLLLHPTCLPGNQGCGVFDEHAIRFLDFLKASSLKYWQVCPLGPPVMAIHRTNVSPPSRAIPT